MLITVKSREVQRGMLAEMRGDKEAARRHLLAAAHLELVLADDYAQAGEEALEIRSRLSAASCLWRAGDTDESRRLLNAIVEDHPSDRASVNEVLSDLEAIYPGN